MPAERENLPSGASFQVTLCPTHAEAPCPAADAPATRSGELSALPPPALCPGRVAPQAPGAPSPGQVRRWGATTGALALTAKRSAHLLRVFLPRLPIACVFFSALRTRLALPFVLLGATSILSPFILRATLSLRQFGSRRNILKTPLLYGLS